MSGVAHHRRHSSFTIAFHHHRHTASLTLPRLSSPSSLRHCHVIAITPAVIAAITLHHYAVNGFITITIIRLVALTAYAFTHGHQPSPLLLPSHCHMEDIITTIQGGVRAARARACGGMRGARAIKRQARYIYESGSVRWRCARRCEVYGGGEVKTQRR